MDPNSGAVTMTRVLATLLAALIAIPLGRILTTWFRLRHINGPTSAGFHKLWLVRAVMGGRTHADLYAATMDFGPLVRVGPRDVVTSDPALIRRINAPENGYRRADSYLGQRVDPAADSILSQRDTALHDRLRARMAPAYEGGMLAVWEERVDRNVTALVRLLEEKYMSGGTAGETRVFDLGRKASFFALDAVTEVAFGQACGFLRMDADVYEYIRRTQENVAVNLLVTALPFLNLLKKSEFVKKWFVPQPEDPNGLGKLMGAARITAASRFESKKIVQKEMVDSFVAQGMTQAEAETEIISQVIAGAEPTATAIRHTLLQLVSNLPVLQTLRAEISRCSPSTPIKDGEARRMPYLEAIVKESLRLFPPVSGLMSKIVPEEGDTYKGIYLPPGTAVSCCTFGACRDQKIFGEDANTFRPERWLYDDEAIIKRREATLELVFGQGRWQCLGRHLALMKMRKVIVELVRRFDIALSDATKPWKSECVGTFHQWEFWVRAFKLEIN